MHVSCKLLGVGGLSTPSSVWQAGFENACLHRVAPFVPPFPWKRRVQLPVGLAIRVCDVQYREMRDSCGVQMIQMGMVLHTSDPTAEGEHSGQ